MVTTTEPKWNELQKIQVDKVVNFLADIVCSGINSASTGVQSMGDIGIGYVNKGMLEDVLIELDRRL